MYRCSGAGSADIKVGGSSPARVTTHLTRNPFTVFLLNLIVVIIVLTADVLLSTGFFAWPLKSLLHQLSIESRPDVVFHPYLAPGALLVAITTLVLFYASGMYAEKIGYANR